MLKRVLTFMLLASVACLSSACGEAELGEACDEEGATEGTCVENSICAKPTSDATEAQCLKICTDDAQCASTEGCNGVSGSNIKACRAK